MLLCAWLLSSCLLSSCLLSSCLLRACLLCVSRPRRDPDKLREGLEQLSSNPALKGLADAVPGLREVLDDPAALEEQASKTAELFSSLGDPDKLQEVLGSLTGGDPDAIAKMQEALSSFGGEGGMDFGKMQEKMLEMMGGADGEGAEQLLESLGALGGGGGDDGDDSGADLKDRVREQLAAMMQRNGGGGGLQDDSLDEF